MKFSSFIVFTAAGLAIAAPITPISPANTEKKLTVEPVEVYSRGLPDTSAVTGLLGGVKRGLPDTSALTGVIGGAAPIKRQLDAVTGLVPGASTDKGEKDIEPKEPKLPSSVDDDDESEIFPEDLEGAVAPASDSAATAVEGAPVSKRQFGGLVPSTSSDDSAEDETDSSDPSDPKEPKEPKEPSSLSGDVSEITKDATDSSPTSKIPIGGLPIGKRQLPTVPSLPSSDSLPIPAGLSKRQLPAGLNSLLGGDKDTPAPDAPTNATATEPAADDAAETPEADDATPAPASGLGGILKRQLEGILGGLGAPKDKPAADAADSETNVKSQVSSPDDGTNTPETRFPTDAEDEAAKAPAAKEAAPAKNATEPAAAPAAEKPAGGLGGLLGM